MRNAKLTSAASSNARRPKVRLIQSAASAVAALPTLAFAANANWTGAGANSNWTTVGNWSASPVPGSTSTDTATFNAAITNTWGNSAGNPIVIDSSALTLRNITFDTAAGNYFLGSTGGNALLLTSGGTISLATTLTAAATETINAPLIVQGPYGTYTFANNRLSSTFTLGGQISGASGNTTLNFAGSFGTNLVSGAIANGSATSVSVNQTSATWTYSGNNSFTGGLTIGDGISATTTAANFTGSNSGANAITINAPGTLNLGTASAGGGAFTNASASFSVAGGLLNLDNTTANTDRINDASTLTLSLGGRLTLNSKSATSNTETIGTLALGSGQSTITLTATQTTGLQAGSLSRPTFGTALVRGTNLGLNTSAKSSIKFTTGPSLVGASASAASTAIVPYLLADTIASGTPAGLGSSFATYDGTLGLRPLTSSEYSAASTYANPANAENVKAGLNATITNSSGITVNSLLFDSAGASTLASSASHPLRVNSGAIASVVNQNNAIGSSFSQLNLDNNEGIVSATAGTLTIAAPIDVTSSSVHSSTGAFTKSGAGTVVLTASNLFSGPTNVNQGTLQIGNGGATGDLGTSSAVNVNLGGTLAYNRSGSLTINDVTGGGIVSNNHASGTLVLNQSAGSRTLRSISGVSGSTTEFTGSGTTSIGSASIAAPASMQTAGAKFKFSNGTINLLDKGTLYKSNLDIAGATVNVVNDGLFLTTAVDGTTQTFNMSGGQLNVMQSLGMRLNNTSGSGIGGNNNANTFVGTQTGGTILITGNSDASGFGMGGVNANQNTTYTLSGGTLQLNATNSLLRLGANASGAGATTFNLQGTGKLIAAGGGSALKGIEGVSGNGARQIFSWTGGTLAAYRIDFSSLKSSTGGTVGTFVNAGGTLAPGDVGSAGRTNIDGNSHYSITSDSAALAIDIAGTTSAGSFQNANAYDNVAITGTSIGLGGRLNVNLVSFTPTNANTFDIITASSASATFTGNFVNLVNGSGTTKRVVLANGLSSFLETIQTTAPKKVILSNYSASNEYSGNGTAWDTASAGAWTSFDPGSTANPSLYASNAIARFADAPASSGAITVALNSTRNIQGVQFASAGSRSYSINNSGAGSLILDNLAYGTSVSITDSSGAGTSNSINVPIALNSDLVASVAQAGNTLSITGAISGSGKTLTKSGSGTLRLTGSNSYSGNTLVTAGTLRVDGNNSASDILLSDNTTLMGIGTTGDVQGAGTVSPGNSIGSLHVAGSYDITGVNDFEISKSTNIYTSDLVDQITTLTYDGILKISLAAGSDSVSTFAGGDSWNLFDFSVSQTGLFDNDAVFGTAGDGVNLPLLGEAREWQFDYQTGTLSVVAVPEPGAIGLIGLAASGLLAKRRRRK